MVVLVEVLVGEVCGEEMGEMHVLWLLEGSMFVCIAWI